MTDAKFRAADSNGGALGGLGAGLQRLSGAVSGYAEAQNRIDEQVDEAAVKQQLVEYSGFRNQQLYTGQNAFSQMQGQNALNARGAVEKSLSDKIGELGGRLKTERAKFLFNDAIGRERERDFMTIGTHAVAQAKVYNDQQDTALQASSAQDMLGATLRGDDVAATAARESLLSSIRNQYARNGLSGEPERMATAKVLSGIHSGVVDAKTLSDPVAAAAYLHAHQAEMLPTDSAKLIDSLYRPLLEREASAVVDGYASAAAGTEPAVAVPAGGGSVSARMIAITAQSESGNRDYANGRLVTSPKGAQAAMQTMPATQRDPGYGVTPARDDSVEEKNRVGRDYLAALARKYGDPAKAWAAYNAGPGRLDAALRDGGSQWLARLPAETQGYVRKNMAMLGGSNTPTYSPRRDDLAGIYAYIEAQNLPFDLKKAALAEADNRVARNDKLLARQEAAARDAAYTAADNLGDGFTSINQLPPAVVRNLSPEARHSLMSQAEQNVKGNAPQANGDAVTNLHQLANLNPAQFKAKDLRTLKPYMTPAEYDQLATLQSSMIAKSDSPEVVSHNRIWQQINFYGRDIGADVSAKKKGETDEAFKARRADGMALFSTMQGILRNITEGKRQPTDDEIKKAFDNAVIPRVMGDGTTAPRYRDANAPRNSIAVPQAMHDSIARRLRAAGLPSDDQTVARVYIQGK